MEEIKDVWIEPCTESNFVQPLRMHYKQNGVQKIWDLVSAHDGVCVIIYNTDRKKLIFVRQFRPSVYYNGIPSENRTQSQIDTSVFPADRGITLELCAGILDKSKSVTETAVAEVLEECGYHISADQLERVISYRDAVGLAGYRMTMFYVQVTDNMNVSQGGGVASEGEFIEVVEMSISEIKAHMEQENLLSPGAFLFAMEWFLQRKLHTTTEDIAA